MSPTHNLGNATPKSPCFLHKYIDPGSSRFEQLLSAANDADTGSKTTTELANTVVGVREISKQLGLARVKTTMKTIMVVTKPGDPTLVKKARFLIKYLITTPRYGLPHGVTCYVDTWLRDHRSFRYERMCQDSPLIGEHLRFWTPELCKARPDMFDLVLTLGGDGTVLFTSWLFQKIVPPVLPFHLGSLGFLTNFGFSEYAQHLNTALDDGIRVNLRMRFTCTVYRCIRDPACPKRRAKRAANGDIMCEQGGTWGSVAGGHGHRCRSRDKNVECFVTQPAESFEVLNDLVVDRGAGPYMSLLELFGDEHHLTTVQADGLVVSTPTGSTAYSVSAGGSLVHPEIPALLLTPICPHTLSFRPMLLPDNMELRICVPKESRSTAWASFDGRGRVELKQGDHIKITPSKFPFPSACVDSPSMDWLNSVTRCLKWNERERQKSFVVVEEDYPDSDEEMDENCAKGEREVKFVRELGQHPHERVFACVGEDNTSGGEDSEESYSPTYQEASQHEEERDEEEEDWKVVTGKGRRRTRGRIVA